jgi:hypothetical protein
MHLSLQKFSGGYTFGASFQRGGEAKERVELKGMEGKEWEGKKDEGQRRKGRRKGGRIVQAGAP